MGSIIIRNKQPISFTIGVPRISHLQPATITRQGRKRLAAIKVSDWAHPIALDIVGLNDKGKAISGMFEVPIDAMESLCVMYLIAKGYRVVKPEIEG